MDRAGWLDLDAEVSAEIADLDLADFRAKLLSDARSRMRARVDVVSPATAGGIVPSAPAGVTLIAGDAKVTAVIAVPSSQGSGPILGYQLTLSTGQIVTSVSPSIVVTGLTNGVAVTATAKASNEAGLSAASASSNSVTPTAATTPAAPGAPTIGTATAGNAQATVTWTAPTSPGTSVITQYIITASTGQVSSPIAAPATSGVVTGLTNGTPATFTVKAYNAVGASAASGASNSVTPAAPPSTTGIARDRFMVFPGSTGDANARTILSDFEAAGVLNRAIRGVTMYGTGAPAYISGPLYNALVDADVGFRGTFKRTAAVVNLPLAVTATYFDPTTTDGQTQVGLLLDEIASGSWDWEYQLTTDYLHSAGYTAPGSTAIARLGWDVNGGRGAAGNPFAWTSLSTANQTKYIAAFRHVVTVMKAELLALEPGATHKILFEFSGSALATFTDYTACYPGDTYVDIVGLSHQDYFPSAQRGGDGKWSNAAAVFTAGLKPNLDALLAFAVGRDAARSGSSLPALKLSMPEWRLVPTTAGGGGDNATYIQSTFDTLQAWGSRLEYHAYYESNETAGSAIVQAHWASGVTFTQALALFKSLYD